MNIDVPGLTPETCQERADWLRKFGHTPESERRVVSTYPDAAEALFRAALMEQYPARPELRVGDLARAAFYGKARVDHIGRQRVFVTHSNGWEKSHSIENITPTGEPAPDDWGQG